jgi:hypothetical protein
MWSRAGHCIMGAALTCAAGVLVEVSQASACSVAGCLAAQIHITGEERTVPANASGVFFAAPYDLYWERAALTDPPMLERLDAPGSDELTASYGSIHPDAWWGTSIISIGGLEDGGEYRLGVEADCDGGGTAIRAFTASAPAEVPAALGRLRVERTGRGEVWVEVHTGSCNAPYETTVAALAVELAEEAAPWKDLLLYETWVDGALWRPSASLVPVHRLGPWQGQSHGDTLFANCGPGELADGHGGLEPGSHIVQMRARLPGGPTLATDEVTVNLKCGGGCAMGGPLGQRAPVWLVLLLLAGLGRPGR